VRVPWTFAVLLVGASHLALGARSVPPTVLPAGAAAKLDRSLADARTRARHVWRDTPPLNPDGTINAYIEIPRGDRRKWELDMRQGLRALDRVMPAELGGYPVNYGLVPQTVSYDGDPFDALVLGPPIAGGRVVRGRIVGVMYMEDEKGHDSKVVLSRVAADGRPLDVLTGEAQREIGDFFNRYKRHEPGAFSRVPGWGPAAEGLAYVTVTHAFFRECPARGPGPCAVGSLADP
jgi:inorganic pyrophosphatase